ncbi:hypothetical protein BCR44DRAFT_1433933, partial [Catenaria anguillulae PL171]
MNNPSKTSSNRPMRPFGFSAAATVDAAVGAFDNTAPLTGTRIMSGSVGLRSQEPAAAGGSTTRFHPTSLATHSTFASESPLALRPAANWSQSSIDPHSSFSSAFCPPPSLAQPCASSGLLPLSLLPSTRHLDPPSPAPPAAASRSGHFGVLSQDTVMQPSRQRRARSSSPSPLPTAAALIKQDAIKCPPYKRQRLGGDDDHANDLAGDDQVEEEEEDDDDDESDDSGSYPTFYAHFSGGSALRFPWSLGTASQEPERGAFDGLLLADLQAEREKEEAEAAAAKIPQGEPRTHEENMERLIAKLDDYRVHQDHAIEDSSDNDSVFDLTSDQGQGQGQAWTDLVLCIQHSVSSAQPASGDWLADSLRAAIQRVRAPPAAALSPVAQPEPGQMATTTRGVPDAAHERTATAIQDIAQEMAAELEDAAREFEAKVREIRERHAARFAVAAASAAAAAAGAVVVPSVAVTMAQVPVVPEPEPASGPVAVSAAVPAMCAICCDLSVEIELDPCGHEMCRACWSRLKATAMCPFDRLVGVTVKGNWVQEPKDG